MSLPDPSDENEDSPYEAVSANRPRRDPLSSSAPLNTVGLGKITVFNYPIEANIFAAMCYLPINPANLIPGFIGLNQPSDNPEFIRFHAVQSLILNGGFLVVCIVLNSLMGILGLIPLLGGLINFGLGLVLFVVTVGYLIISLKTLLSAYRGNEASLPFIGHYAREYSK